MLAVSNRLDAKCRKFLQAMDVIAYPVQFNCSKGGGGIKSSNFCDWHEKQDLQIPIAIIRHELYLSWAWVRVSFDFVHHAHVVCGESTCSKLHP